MSDVLDKMVSSVLAIKEDPNLKSLFLRILELGSATQQVRVSLLLGELEKIQAPSQVLQFVELLQNEQMAQAVLQELRR